MSALNEAVRLAHQAGLSYAQFQRMESAGTAYIKDGKLYIEEVSNEHNRRNKKKKS